MDRRAADIADTIGTDDRVVLIGWSLGGLESLHYVHRYGDERLAAMVLVDNSVGEPPVPVGSNVIARLKADREATVDRFARSLFASPQPESKIDEIKRSMLKMRLQDSIALLSGQPPREHWRAIARRFAKPLVYAVTSRYQEQAANLKKNRPETRIEIFRNAGHALFVDEPERFNRILSDVAATAFATKSVT